MTTLGHHGGPPPIGLTYALLLHRPGWQSWDTAPKATGSLCLQGQTHGKGIKPVQLLSALHEAAKHFFIYYILTQSSCLLSTPMTKQGAHTRGCVAPSGMSAAELLPWGCVHHRSRPVFLLRGKNHSVSPSSVGSFYIIAKKEKHNFFNTYKTSKTSRRFSTTRKIKFTKSSSMSGYIPVLAKKLQTGKAIVSLLM